MKFDLVFRLHPCCGWQAILVLDGVEQSRGKLHREIDDAVEESAVLIERLFAGEVPKCQ